MVQRSWARTVGVMAGVMAGVMVGLMSVVGCGNEPPRVDGPVLVSGSRDGGNDAIVAGEVTVDDGCLLLGGIPVVWPVGTTWDGETHEVVLSNGDRIAMGDEVTGAGGYSDVDSVADVTGERGASIAAECAGPTREVAVFNAGSDVTRVD